MHTELTRYARPGASFRFTLGILVLLVATACSEAFAGGFNNRHVIVIGIDGCRSEALQIANAPNLRALATNGSVSWDAVGGGYPGMVTEQRTDRGPGWASVLTGSWQNTHHVTSDSLAGYVPGVTPHFFERIKQGHPTAWLGSFVEWAPIDTTFVAPIAGSVAVHQTALDGDTTDLVTKVSDILSYQAPDVLVVQFDGPGIAGQASGFSTMSPGYLDAISRVDAGVGAIVQAVQFRVGSGGEDWLFVVVGTSNGDPDGQLWLTAAERNTFMIVSGPQAVKQVVSGGPAITCVPSTVYTFLTGSAAPASYNWDPTTFGLEASALTNRLQVYLNFDNTLAPQGGTTIGATVYAGTPKYGPGLMGQAAHFTNPSGNGQPTDWAASLGNQDALYAGDFSVSVWTRMVTGLDGALVGNKDWSSGYNRGWVISEEAAKNVNWGDNTYRRDVSLPAVTNGSWHHIVISFNRAGGIACTYLDGVLKDMGAPGGSFAGGLNTLIGSSGNGKWSGTGDVDELAIWTRALTSYEVSDLYLKGLAGAPLTASFTSRAVILRQPVSRVAGLGQTVRFHVEASGNGLSYQWQHDGTDVAGATGPALCITNISMAHAGAYSVAISNAGGTTNSAPATLTVTPLLGGVNYTNGLVAHVSFDGNFKDTSGNDYHGTPVGAPSFVQGVLGSAMRFHSLKDGTSFNYVSLGTNVVKEIATNDYTLVLWYRHRNTNQSSTIDPPILANKNWDSGSNRGLLLAEQASGEWKFVVASNSRMDVPGGRIGDGAWHHLAITCSRTNGTTVYQDGLPVTVQPTIVTGSLDSGLPLNLGQDGRGIYTFGGKVGITNAMMDDFGLWKRALTANEIALIHAEGCDGRSFEQQSPVVVMQPHSISARVHMGHTLLAMVAGTPPLQCQWFKDNQPLPGWTNSWWSFKDFTTNDAGSYTLVVSNRFGTATSDPALVAVSTNEWGYAPIVLHDAGFTINKDQPLTIATNDVLGLAENLFGEWLGYSLDVPVSLQGGPVTLTANGSVVYTPPAGFMGQDWFFINFMDPHGGGNASVISVTVTNGLIPHVTTHNTNVVTTAWQMLGLSAQQILALAHDPLGEPLTYYVTQHVTPGQQTVWMTTFGTITYNPSLILGSTNVFLGPDQFDITFRDARGGVATATVFVDVQPAVGGNSVPPQVVVHSPNTPANPGLNADFAAGANLVYVVETATTLDGPWTFLFYALAEPDGALPTEFPINRNEPSRFFRIRLAQEGEVGM